MSILTVAELRTHVQTTLTDAALQRILDANEAIILDIIEFTPGGNVTELRWPQAYESVILLGVRASSIASVKVLYGTDGELTLNADDYYHDRATLRRRVDGTNPSDWWEAPVQVIYTPALNPTSLIEMIEVDLAKLDINTNPGLRAFTVGQHREEYETGGGGTGGVSTEEKRALILGRLTQTKTPLFA